MIKIQDWEVDMPENLRDQLRFELETDILERYSNTEYWNHDLINDWLREHGYELK